jgi:hypothetical protein
MISVAHFWIVTEFVGKEHWKELYSETMCKERNC